MAKEAKFDYWQEHIAPKNVDPKEHKAMYNREVGLTKLKDQMKTISFILD